MEKYFRHRTKIDWAVALLVGIIPSALKILGLYSNTPSPVDERVFLTTATIAATLLGFSLASASFLISHTNSERVKFLRKSKSFSQLTSLLSSAIWRFFALLIVSMISFVAHDAFPTFSFGAYIAICAAAIFSATALVWSVAAIVRFMQ